MKTVKHLKLTPVIAMIIFVGFVTLSIVASIGSYKTAEWQVKKDLDQALLLTLQQKKDLSITPDTIKTYRNNLNIPMLKERACMSYCMEDDRNDVLSSRKVAWKQGFVRGYANCSTASIFSLSDQRLPATLYGLSAAWMVFMFLYFKKRRAVLVFANITYDLKNDCFANSRKENMHLTPMQHQLMRMFFMANNNQLSQKEICEALWPKKEAASQTLHTMISRLKKEIEPNRATIEVDRGKSYKLTRYKM